MSSEQVGATVNSGSPDVSGKELKRRLHSIPISSVDWDLYRAFLSLVHTGSARLAAATLGVSVATLKRRLDRLEGNLQAKIYEGDSANFKLTEFGAEVYYYIDKAHGTLNNSSALGSVNNNNNVTMQVLPGVFNLLLVTFFQEYSLKFSNIDFSIVIKKHFEYSKKIKNDIFISGYPIDNNSLVSIPIAKYLYNYAVTKRYADINDVPKIDNLENHRFILTDICLRRPETLESTLDIAERSRSIIRAETFVDSDTLVRGGAGFGLVFSTEHPEEFELIEGLPEVESVIYLHARKDFIADPKYKDFFETFLTFTRDYFSPNKAY